MGYSPWGRKESDVAEVTQHIQQSMVAGFPRLESRLALAAGYPVTI